MGSSVNISVIVPFHNVEAYLEPCIESILTTDLEIELLLVDDGSTDGSGRIAERYATSCPNVFLLRQPHSGPSVARNRGLEVAKGEYIAFIDSDDWVETGAFERLYDCAIRQRADMAMGQMFAHTSESTNPIIESLPESLSSGRVVVGSEYFIALMQAGIYFPMACSYIYRREWVEQHGLRFEAGVIHEDELWTQVALCCAERVTNEYRAPFYYYRQRQGSIMHTFAPFERTRSLFCITRRIVEFAERYSWENRSDRVLRSWIYANVSRIYAGVFISLVKATDSSVPVSEHHLDMLEQAIPRMETEAGERCAQNCRIARGNELAYEQWKKQPWNHSLSALSEEEIRTKKIILFYNSVRWHNEDLAQWDRLPAGFAVTDDRRYYDRAYAVVFDLTSLAASLAESKHTELDKPDGQYWISWSMECEKNYPILKDEPVLSMFDLQVTYRRDGDVVCPYYGDFTPSSIPAQIDFSTKNEGVCMFISSQLNHSHRQEYLEELMKYIPIDSYGSLFRNKTVEEDKGWVTKHATYARYRFIIAFENAIAEDYVTEKFYDPLLAGAVPIYLGAPNVEDFAPGDRCYIDVRNFGSPRELAQYLRRCMTDNEEYMKYHQWRRKPWRADFLNKLKVQQDNSVLVRVCQKLENLQPLSNL